MTNYCCGDVNIDTAGRMVGRPGQGVTLEPRVFGVILELLARPGALVTRDQLLDAVWGHRHVTRSALNRVIVHARRAFGDDAVQPRYIGTVHGTGYRYIGPPPTASPASSQGLGRVWYVDLATENRGAERLRALKDLLGLPAQSDVLAERLTAEHILIRLHYPSHDR